MTQLLEQITGVSPYIRAIIINLQFTNILMASNLHKSDCITALLRSSPDRFVDGIKSLLVHALWFGLIAMLDVLRARLTFYYLDTK